VSQFQGEKGSSSLLTANLLTRAEAREAREAQFLTDSNERIENLLKIWFFLYIESSKIVAYGEPNNERSPSTLTWKGFLVQFYLINRVNVESIIYRKT